MEIGDVFAVLDALAGAGLTGWVAGGWGVDVLAGRQTREHRDLDLTLDGTGEARVLAVLAGLGYRIETDWRPTRVEVAADGARWVDLHPVIFDDDGSARLPGLDGIPFVYPVGAFTTGRLAGREIGCLSREQQLTFRTGYPLRPVDHHDIAVLTGLR